MEMTTATINRDSTMAEVLQAYPGARRAMMRRYHIGGCGNCGFGPMERLGDVLARHNVLDVDEVIAHVAACHEEEQRMQIEPRELHEALRGANPPKLIDVRGEEEQSLGMLPGALKASQTLVQEMMASWSKDTPIVTYCHHGLRSLDAASYLIGHGFTRVMSLRGGTEAWALEVDTSMPRY